MDVNPDSPSAMETDNIRQDGVEASTSDALPKVDINELKVDKPGELKNFSLNIGNNLSELFKIKFSVCIQIIKNILFME